jgi:hypothetical protein
VDLDVPRLRPVLPHAESLTLLSNTEGLQTGFQWDVQLVPGFDRNHELAAFQLVGGGHITANGPLRHSAIGTNANFLLEVRAQLWCQNGAGVTGATSALVSASWPSSSSGCSVRGRVALVDWGGLPGQDRRPCGCDDRPAAKATHRNYPVHTGGMDYNLTPVHDHTETQVLEMPEDWEDYDPHSRECQAEERPNTDEDPGPLEGRASLLRPADEPWDTDTVVGATDGVRQVEAGTRGNGSLGNGAYANTIPTWPGTYFPGVCAHMSMTSGHRDWVLLNVGSPHDAIVEAETGDWNRCDFRARNMLDDFKWSTWLVACIDHFAVYDTVVERYGIYRWVRIRYWVGLTLHPSVLSGNSAWEGAPEIDGIPEELREDKSTLLQTFMSACTGVAARVVWAKTYGQGGARYRGNRRYYPAGGDQDYDNIAYSSGTGPVPTMETTWNGYYEGDANVADDGGLIAFQTTAGAAYSMVGNMARGTVRFFVSTEGEVDTASLARKGFSCLFGSHAATQLTIGYVPSGQEEATEPYHLMSTRKLSADDLVHVNDWVDHWRARFETDRYTQYLYQAIDYRHIDADRLS